MTMEEKLAAAFPAAGEIPAEFRAAPVEQKDYLVNGRIKAWTGPRRDVFSPAGLRGKKGPERVRLGSYPLMTQKEALEALEAASAAYDDGRGLWPTLSVEARIAHMEEFAWRMKEKRDEVVSLLMWEIS